MTLPDPLPGWLAPGSLVKLISGGPLMTVVVDTLVPIGITIGRGVDPPERRVSVTWFDAGGHRMEAKLPREAIAPAPGQEVADRLVAHVYELSMQARPMLDRIGRALAVAQGYSPEQEPEQVIGRITDILAGKA